MKGAMVMKCVYCGSEIPNESRFCSFCGKTTAQIITEISEFKTDPQTSNLTNIVPAKKRKGIKALIAVAIVFLVGFGSWAFAFRLTGEDAIVYELIVENATVFHSPRSVRVISGTGGESPETGKYAFVTLVAENAYGAERSDFYTIDEKYGVGEAVYSLQGMDFDYSYLCKRENLNTWKINLRLSLYWLLK